jgi:hypothetical protein
VGIRLKRSSGVLRRGRAGGALVADAGQLVYGFWLLASTAAGARLIFTAGAIDHGRFFLTE